MLNIIKKNKQTKEEKVTHKLSLYLCKKYNAKVDYLVLPNVAAIHVHNDNFDIAFTTCDTPYGRRIKIEDFIIKEEYRNKKLGTEILNEIINFCKEDTCTVGLWCRKENIKAYNFYINNGFKYITTKDDHWLEY